MRKLIGTLVVSGSLAVLPGTARPQVDEQADSSGFVAGVAAETAPPSTQAPSELPPSPPSEVPPEPPAQVQPPPSTPPGQWVYTEQYGWIWMAYADSYMHVPPDGYGQPYAYAYYPTYGWCWLAAPWVWGFGPWPSFGIFGPARFGWYGHGWWRNPGRWHYAPSRGGSYGPRPAPAFRGGAGFGGARPPPYRSGAGTGGARPPPHQSGAGFGGGRPSPSRGGAGYGGARPSPSRGGAGFSGHGASDGHGRSGHR
jgi:hypothetical protein